MRQSKQQSKLSVCLSTNLTVCLSADCLSAGLSARLSEYLSVYLYIWPLCLFVRLSICLTICLAGSLSTSLSVCLFVHLELRWSGLRKSSLCLPVSPCICRSSVSLEPFLFAGSWISLSLVVFSSSFFFSVLSAILINSLWMNLSVAKVWFLWEESNKKKV